MKQAIEIRGTIDSSRHLILDEQLSVSGPMRVEVIIVLGERPEVNESEWLAGAASNEAFEYLRDPAEDVYTLSDGKRPRRVR